MPDDGLPLFSATTLSTTGAAIISILSMAFSPGVKNRFLHISDFTTSLAEIITIIEKLDGAPWTRKSVPAKEISISSMANVDAGTFGKKEFWGALISPFFGGVSPWQQDDNELLGLGDKRSLTEEVANAVTPFFNHA